MTLKLILIRHAKSSWTSFGQDDHARPLNERGHQQAPLIGAWLQARGHIPDLILSSDAQRTRDTCEHVMAGLDSPPEVRFDSELYLASAPVMLTALHKAQGQTVAMIGHNPGIGDFADILCSTPPQHDRFADYPTGATTVLTFVARDWAGVQIEKGTVIDFTIPSDLG